MQELQEPRENRKSDIGHVEAKEIAVKKTSG